MPDLFFLNWSSYHEWIFWLTMNTCAYLSHWFFLRHTILGLLALILPITAGTATIIMASEMWVGGIGIVFILLTAVPLFITAVRHEKENK